MLSKKRYTIFELILLYISAVILFLTIIDAIQPIFTVISHFYILIFLATSDFLSTRRITLFQIWVASFIFIIWADMMMLSLDRSFILYKDAIIFLLGANDTFLLGYLLYKPKSNKEPEKRVIKHKNIIPFLLTVSLFFYFSSSYKTLLSTIDEGRDLSDVLGSGNLWSSIANALGSLIPVFAAFHYKYYSKKSIFVSLFWALPVFIIQAVLGTRFRLLFMIIPYCIILNYIDIRRMSIKKILTLTFLIIGLITITNFIKEYRNNSIVDILGDNVEFEQSDLPNDSFLIKLANNMSPEGIVHMTYLANDYFSNHELRYGLEIGNVVYFIIPRSIWPNKPTPIDHWLIRLYDNVADEHSTASGFTGEIRADFGMGCFIILFIWGIVLKLLDDYSKRIYNQNGAYYNKILASIIYPYIFFFVRSPLTASYSFIFELVLYFFFMKCCTKRII